MKIPPPPFFFGGSRSSLNFRESGAVACATCGVECAWEGGGAAACAPDPSADDTTAGGGTDFDPPTAGGSDEPSGEGMPAACGEPMTSVRPDCTKFGCSSFGASRGASLLAEKSGFW